MNPLASTPSGCLKDWHSRLETQFETLRNQQNAGFVFALEHGLSTHEVRDLQECVRATSWSATRRIYWLPWVVYAAEIGYAYSGNEYWQTFENRTPRWSGVDRPWIRQIFGQFAKRFRGAEPSGIWAEHFTIICWPITHAILPKDLQVELAHTLFDIRLGLDPEILQDSTRLGALIHARSWGRSRRFQQFSTQEELVGIIARALVTKETEDTDHLVFPETLERVAHDLQQTHDAREWLKRAREVAGRVRIGGTIMGGGGSGTGVPPGKVTRAGVLQDTGLDLTPRVRLRKAPNAWEVWLDVPEMRSLASTSSSVAKILGETRVYVRGNDMPRPRGSLMDGFSVELKEWPHSGQALLELERTTPVLEFLLSSTIVSATGSVMLFRVSSEYEGTLLGSLVVRPDRAYVILSEESLQSDHLGAVACTCEGLYAYEVTLPKHVPWSMIQDLRRLGLKDVLDIAIQPAGLSAPGWDGENGSQWLEGDQPRFAVSSSSECEVALSFQDEEIILKMTAGVVRFFSLPRLPLGEHSVDVFVATNEETQRGKLSLTVREPRERVSGLASPLRLRAEPPSPTLEEIWEGRASIQAQGPRETKASLVVTFSSREGKTYEKSWEVHLPLEADRWGQMLSQLQSLEDCTKAYDEATSVLIRMDAGLLGNRTLEAFPALLSLKWATERTNESYSLRIIDQFGAQYLSARRYTFERPDQSGKIGLDNGRVNSAEPGLYVVSFEEHEASVVVAPTSLHSLKDLAIRPKLSGKDSNSKRDRAARLIRVLHKWAGASTPGSALAITWRQQVVTDIEAQLFLVLCGTSWAQRVPREPWNFTTSKLQTLAELVAPSQPALTAAISRNYSRMLSMPLHQRIADFARVTGVFGAPPHALLDMFSAEMNEDNYWLAEFVLRLASQPNLVERWAGRAMPWGLDQTLGKPAALRAARFLVHALDCMELAEEQSRFGFHAEWGWV